MAESIATARNLDYYDDTPLQALLNQANGYVTNRTAIPADLAIRILAASNREQRWESLQAVITHSRPGDMSRFQYGEYSIQLLRALQNTRQYAQAENWLNSQQFLNQLPLLDSDQQILLSLERANNHQFQGRFLESARERIFVQDFILDPRVAENNATLIWQDLLTEDRSKLQRSLRRHSGDGLTGWVELALIQQDLQQDLATQTRALQDWRQRWPQHPAQRYASDTSSSFPRSTSHQFVFNQSSDARRVGVLLPLSGKLQGIGKAVRDGLLSAHFASGLDQASLPQLKFYDTQSASIETLYNRATADRVDLLIGPLQKQHVKALFTMPTSIPVLTLNFVPDDLPPPANIVQFGLAAEDEASQLAQTLFDQGYSQPLLLVVDKDWALRAADSFKQQWQQSRSTAPIVQRLSLGESYSAEIARSLGLPDSERRRSALQNAVGMQFEFKPRRRQDIDAVVLLANSREAKSIKPLLAYHYASDLPVFASSHVYDAAPGDNSDLNGIVFTEMPWFLANGKNRDSQNLARSLYSGKSQQRLFAMGVDAYQLFAYMKQLQQLPQMRWPANTGQLAIRNNRVVRELPLARLTRGKPKPLQSE